MTKIFAISGVAAAALLATAAAAQTQPAQAPAQPAQAPSFVASGAPTPGVCVVSREEIVAKSPQLKAVEARMAELKNDAARELQPKHDAVQAKLNAGDRSPAVEKDATEFQILSTVRDEELKATYLEQLQGVINTSQPLLQQAMQESKCAIVFEKAAAVATNPAMDLTDAVVRKMTAMPQAKLTFPRANHEAEIRQAINQRIAQASAARQASQPAGKAPASSAKPVAKKK